MTLAIGARGAESSERIAVVDVVPTALPMVLFDAVDGFVLRAISIRAGSAGAIERAPLGDAELARAGLVAAGVSGVAFEPAVLVSGRAGVSVSPRGLKYLSCCTFCTSAAVVENGRPIGVVFVGWVAAGCDIVASGMFYAVFESGNCDGAGAGVAVVGETGWEAGSAKIVLSMNHRMEQLNCSAKQKSRLRCQWLRRCWLHVRWL